MPIYDFKCQECGEVSEFLVPGPSASREFACQSCGSKKMDKLISVPSLLRNVTKSGTTCCGRTERCDKPPCSSGGKCSRG
jgi:putative FmdB family regulatory protein